VADTLSDNRIAELKDKVANTRWFHAIDFGDFQSAGRFKEGVPPNKTLYGAIDLLQHIDISGATCVDVGSAHGLVSFGLKTKGAKKVLAVDNSPRMGVAFGIARELLGLDVEYVYSPCSQLVNTLGARSADLVVAAGLMYHLANPGDAIFQTRRVLKPGGLLVIETAYAANREDAVLVFNNVPNAPYDEPYTYFLPSKSAVVEMLRLACFDVLAVRTGDPNRLTVLARAVAPEQVDERCELTVKAHDIGTQDVELPFTDFRSDTDWTANVTYDGLAEPEKHIDDATFDVEFPPHPRAMTNPLGISVRNKEAKKQQLASLARNRLK
jgi:tRNA (mo5U34)-methyltransferase